MNGLGWGEMALIGVVALLVIGPRDLPEMFRQLGRMSGKLKSMAREFSRAMEAAANESGINEVARDLNTVANPQSAALSSVKEAMDKFEKWDPVKNAARPSQPLTASTIKPLTPPPMPPTPKPAVVEAAVASPAPGPNTKALMEKQAARKAIMDEAAAKVKALDAAPASDATAPDATTLGSPAKPARAPRKKPVPKADA